MSLWRLELLRLFRTHRWAILFGVYLLFGVLGAVTAAYMEEIITRFGGGIEITFPDPRPIDGMIQFVSNSSQLGLLAVVIVAAGALGLDTRPELAAFFRTRVGSARWLVIPRYVVITVAAAAALVAGTAVTWALTSALLGPLDVTAMIVGTGYGAVYLAFAVAVLAAMAGLFRSNVAAIFGAFAVIIALPVIGLVPTIQPWLPSELLTAVLGLLEGESAATYLRSLSVTIVATIALLALSAWRFEVREV